MPPAAAADLPESTRTLSVDAVISAALEILDNDGIEAVSLSGVARALGCHVTSLYSYVESSDDLHIKVIMAIQSALRDAVWRSALGRSGADALTAIAQEYRHFGTRYPARSAMLARASGMDEQLRPGEMDLAEPVRATLRGLGFDDAGVRLAHRAFSASIRGFLAGQAANQYGNEEDETFDYIVATCLSGIDACRE